MQPSALKSWAAFASTMMWIYLGCAALVVLLSMSIECCRHSSSSVPTSHLTAARAGTPAAASFTVLASGSNLVGRLLYPQVRPSLPCLCLVSPRPCRWTVQASSRQPPTGRAGSPKGNPTPPSTPYRRIHSHSTHTHKSSSTDRR